MVCVCWVYECVSWCMCSHHRETIVVCFKRHCTYSYNVQGPCACNNESPAVSGTMHGVTCISCLPRVLHFSAIHWYMAITSHTIYTHGGTYCIGIKRLGRSKVTHEHTHTHTHTHKHMHAYTASMAHQ